MKKGIIIIAVVALGYFGYNQLSSKTDSVAVSSESQGAIVEANNSINEILDETREVVAKVSLTEEEIQDIQEGTTDLTESEVEVVVETPSKAPGNYVAYADTDISTLDGDIVLDFYASWCPSCRKLEADIKDSLSDIPSDLTIVNVNYDTQTDLKAQYGVTKQHTLVQVDQQGNLIKKWSGGSTLESIVANVE